MSDIITGFAKVEKVKCNESPFKLNELDGRIYFNDNLYLVKTNTTFLGTRQVRFGKNDDFIVSALNFAYQQGYEKNREILIPQK